MTNNIRFTFSVGGTTWLNLKTRPVNKYLTPVYDTQRECEPIVQMLNTAGRVVP